MQGIKSTLGKWTFGGLLVLVVLGFVAFDNDGNFIFKSQKNNIATVGSTIITSQEFLKNFEEQRKNLASQIGREVSVPMARSQGIDHYVLDDMINEAVLTQYARIIDSSISNERISAFTTSLPVFLKPDQKTFDPEAFHRFLSNRRMSESEFKRQIEHLLLIEDIKKILSPQITAPRALAESFYKQKHEQRNVNLLHFTAGNVKLPPEPEGKDLEEFYKSNQEFFRLPEYRSGVVATFNSEALMPSIIVSDDEVEKAYQNRINEFATPEKRDVYQYLFPSKEEAEAFLAKYSGKGDILEFAEKNGFPRKKHFLGTIEQKDLTDESMQAVFSLPLHQVSSVVETDFGHAIYSVTKIQPASQKPFSEVKSLLLNDLKQHRAQEKMVTLLTELEDDQAAGTSVEDIAAKYGIKPRILTDITQLGLDKNQKDVNSISMSLLNAFFKTGINADDPILEEDNGAVYHLYRVNSITESTIPALEDIKDTVLAHWKQKAGNRLLADLISAVIDEIKQGASVAAIAEKHNVFMKTQTFFADKPSKEFSTDFLRQIFKTPVGGVTSGQDQAEQKWFVAYIHEQKLPDLTTDTAKKEIRQLQNRLNDIYADELYGQFIAAIRTEIGVKINYEAMNEILGRMSN